MQRPWIPDLDPRLRMSRTSVGNDRKRERDPGFWSLHSGLGDSCLETGTCLTPDRGMKKEKGSHMAAFLLCLGCEHAVHDAGLWMRWLLFIRAEGADEVHGIIRRMSAERSANRSPVCRPTPRCRKNWPPQLPTYVRSLSAPVTAPSKKPLFCDPIGAVPRFNVPSSGSPSTSKLVIDR